MKGSKYKFLWRNYQSDLTIQTNLESVLKFPNHDWNRISGIIEISRNNSISCYHTAMDLEKDIERGKKLLQSKYIRKIFQEIDKKYEEYWNMFEKLKKEDFQRQDNNKLITWIKRIMDKWSEMISYFRFSQAEGTYYLTEEIKKEFSEDEIGILMLSVELDEMDKEAIEWEKIIKEPYNKEKILQHAYKFPWIVMSHETFERVLDTLKNKYENDKSNFRYRDIIKEKQILKEKQDKIISKKSSLKELIEIAQKISVYRIKVKSCWSGSDLYMIKLYEEISKRTGIHVTRLWKYYLREELIDLIKNKSVLTDEELLKRDKCFVGLLKSNKIYYYSGEEAEKIALKELGKNSEITKTILTGKIAYPGKIKGIARIMETNNIEQTQYFRKYFRKNEILITGMTQPNIMDIASRAGAIVTDEGGMLSHAAIISRELKIPCIVGTQYSTQIIKDGDLVEVDASTGIVKILERAK